MSTPGGRKREMARAVYPELVHDRMASRLEFGGEPPRRVAHTRRDPGAEVELHLALDPAQLRSPRLVVGGGLGPFAQVRHGLDHQDRVVPDGGLGRQHHCGGAVEHGVGDVGGLGPGGRRRVDHRLEHLGGGDDRDTERHASADDLLLEVGDLGDVALVAQVPAGDHDGVGHVDDVVEGVDGGLGLDLGHDGGVAGADLHRLDLVGRSDEGRRDEVEIGGEGVDQLDVAIGGNRHPEAARRECDTRAALDAPTVLDLHDEVVVSLLDGQQAHAAVSQHQRVADVDVLDDVDVVDVDGVECRGLATGQHHEPLAFRQEDAVVGRDRTHPDLRSRKVAQDGDRTPHRRRHLADPLDAGAMLVDRPVGQSEAAHVDPRLDQVAQNGLGIGRGADGCHDLGATGHGRTLPRSRQGVGRPVRQLTDSLHGGGRRPRDQ